MESKKKKSTVREYIEAILTAVLIALFIRSFAIEAFKIPSSSMIPTLMIGDHIFVNKFIYGMRIPLTKIRFLQFKEPQRGDVVVFMYPKDEGKDFIKRVVGLPGDKVMIKGDHLYINDEEVDQEPLRVKKPEKGNKLMVFDNGDHRELPYFNDWKNFNFYEEEIGRADFVVQYETSIYHRGGTYEVPEGHLFVMGDNRDNSSDSREWGFVPLDNIKGKAMFIWLSLNKENGGIRFDRIGKWIK